MEDWARNNQHKYLLDAQLLQFVNAMVIGHLLVLLPLLYVVSFPSIRETMPLIPFITAGLIYAWVWLAESEVTSSPAVARTVAVIATIVHWAVFIYLNF